MDILNIKFDLHLQRSTNWKSLEVTIGMMVYMKTAHRLDRGSLGNVERGKWLTYLSIKKHN